MSKIFVIEGTDGSGKQTQVERLCERLEMEGKEFLKVSFPRYENASSSLVKMYLGGEFGQNANDVSPYVASIFYAVDRYAAYKQEIEEAIKEDKIIVLDRYTTANMVHQTGKINDTAEREKFLNWVWDLEMNIMGLPKPDKVFFLKVAPEMVNKLIKNRNNKITGEGQKDIHEKDTEHLKAAYEAGVYVATKYNWYQIECIKNEAMRTIEDIHKEIYSEVEKMI